MPNLTRIRAPGSMPITQAEDQKIQTTLLQESRGMTTKAHFRGIIQRPRAETVSIHSLIQHPLVLELRPSVVCLDPRAVLLPCQRPPPRPRPVTTMVKHTEAIRPTYQLRTLMIVSSLHICVWYVTDLASRAPNHQLL